MTLKTACPHCQKVLKVSSKAAGQTLPCPVCKQPVRIPSQVESLEELQPAVSASNAPQAPPPLRADTLLAIRSRRARQRLALAERIKRLLSRVTRWSQNTFDSAKRRYNIMNLRRQMEGLESVIEAELLDVGSKVIDAQQQDVPIDAERRSVRSCTIRYCPKVN